MDHMHIRGTPSGVPKPRLGTTKPASSMHSLPLEWAKETSAFATLCGSQTNP